MSDSTRPNPEVRIDRYVRRELTAAEARELAQESLDSPELFEELTFSALATAALSSRSVPGGKILRFPRKARIFVAGAIAAAAVVLVSLYSVRSSFLRPNGPPNAAPVGTESVSRSCRGFPPQAGAGVFSKPRPTGSSGERPRSRAGHGHAGLPRSGAGQPFPSAGRRDRLYRGRPGGDRSWFIGRLGKGKRTTSFSRRAVDAAHRPRDGDHGFSRARARPDS